MARDAEPTKIALVAAAERLFASHGIDRVSLREVTRASGARNAVALQYHFKDRSGVVRAVVKKHFPEVDRQRHDMLDAYEKDGTRQVRQLSAALVVPLATKLSDADGGPEYLQINAELLSRLRTPMEVGAQRNSIDRWRTMVEPFLEQDATRLHRRFTAIRFSATELGLRAKSAPHRDDRLFISQLVDQVTALLLAPVSAQTSSLAMERDRGLSTRTA